MLRWHWSKRYKLQQDYGYLINAAIENKHKVRVKEKRKLEIYSYRKQLLDPDNLYGSVKFLLDAIQQADLIWDDNPDYLSLSVCQEIDKNNPRTEVIIYVLGGGKSNKNGGDLDATI
jgi:Holliday junction resolvase RusA-like endonuclease